MKIIFYLGILCVIVFEITKIYLFKFISVETAVGTLDLAYFIHYWRWDFRLLFWMLILWGVIKIYDVEKPKSIYWSIGLAASITYITNFILLPDLKSNLPKPIQLVGFKSNNVQSESAIIGVVLDGVAKAYPIQFIEDHSQIVDSIGNSLAMVTYCKICKNGKVFEPTTNGRPNQFALLGFDSCNAMLEDLETGSWWRQSDGMALAGKMKGTSLSEFPFDHVSLEKWVSLHPETIIMQPDSGQLRIAHANIIPNNQLQLSGVSQMHKKNKNRGTTKITSIIE
jgi:hypothetical protein